MYRKQLLEKYQDHSVELKRNRSLYNSTFVIYDPYKNEVVDIIEFPGISHQPGQFVSGVDIHPESGLVSIISNAAAAFMVQPAGSDISGSNFVMLWDPKTREVLYRVNLTETSQGRYGGVADVEQDPDGNVYVNTMFPGTILRLERYKARKAPKVKEWFLSQPRNTSIDGFGGLATKGWSLITHDNSNGQLLKFDMRSRSGVPVVIPVTPSNATFLDSDALTLPQKYNGTVLLIAGGPGIRVFRSKDGKWNDAEFLGTVTRASFNLPPDQLATAAVQVGDGLNLVVVPTGDVVVAGTLAGNRTEFPFYDITTQVEELLRL